MWSSVRERCPVWYFDSTGGVIKKVKNQSAPFLFSIVFHDRDKKLILPLAEFISTAHDSRTISSYLYTIKYEIERTLNKKTFRVAPIICTDFSFALLNAACNVFNNCTLEFYLKWCFEILFRKAKSISIGSCMQVIFHLCGAHFLKMVVKKVKKIKKYNEDSNDKTLVPKNTRRNKNLQNLFIFSFSLLQNSIQLDDFINNFILLHHIFNEKYYSKKVSDSFSAISKQLLDRGYENISIKKEPEENEPNYKKEEEKYHEYSKFNSFDKNDESSLKKKSLFANYFLKLLESLSKHTEIGLSENKINNEN